MQASAGKPPLNSQGSSIPVFTVTSRPSLAQQQPPRDLSFPSSGNSSSTDNLYRLYLEFYVGGNVILGEKESTILAVLQIAPAGEDGRGECKVSAKYNAKERPSTPSVTLEKISGVLKKAEGQDIDPSIRRTPNC
ncbi:hypothetical protein RUND412_009763 [Rhizina undulata]